jgi:23S rRNA pseudouridine1911/1915/1917 synthase
MMTIMPSATNQQSYTVPVPKHKAGTRLDSFLAEALPDMSRTRFKSLIEGGQVSREGDSDAVLGPSQKVKAGQVYRVDVPPAIPALPQPQDMSLDVVFEDDNLIVINKPAGLVVHPAPGHYDGTLVNALLHHCQGSLSGIGGVSRPGIVHRLDKDTSGLLVAAKNDATHHGLSEQFSAHTVRRSYSAVVWGMPTPREGTIEGNIGRSPSNRKKMAMVARGGKTAITHYKVERAIGTHASLVTCRLETGRTHQIRVHMTSIGHSLICDPVYDGGAARRLRSLSDEQKKQLKLCEYQALHALNIGFYHPITGEHIDLNSKVTSYINTIVKILDIV